MDIYEQAVLDYCAAAPGRFISPQCYIAFDETPKSGWSMPDVVVLDFSRSTIYVVEVTSASVPADLLWRVTERQRRWYDPLRASSTRMHEPFSRWNLRVTLFVREEICGTVSTKFKDASDVSVISLDRVMFPWRWNWQNGMPDNPLE